ncbi:MAG: putative bifunctional diguanylate cyclase/phosphodiesterase [Pseudomonadota bacterium]
MNKASSEKSAASLEDEINFETLRQLWAGLGVSLVITLLLAGVVVYALWGAIDHDILTGWFALVFLVVIARAVLFRDFERQVNGNNAATWLNIFRLGVVLSGSVWGVAGVLLYSSSEVSSQAFIAFLLVGVSAGGMMAYYTDIYCSLPFLLANITPLMLRNALEENSFARGMSATILFFIIFLVFVMQRAARQSRQNIRIRLGAVQQAEKLRKSEARFRQMFERPSSPMLLIDALSGRIVDANLAASRFYGYSLASLKKMSLAQLSGDEIALDSGATSGLSIGKHRLSGGKIRTVEIYASLIKVDQRQLRFAIVHDVTQRLEAEEKAHSLAFYDPLTQLANRRLLHESLHKMLATTSRHHFHGGLMFLDLDNFKAINDTEGHEVGDQLLKEVARRLNLCVRESDLLGRLGGDEFVVMCEGLSADVSEAAVQAETLAEKIRAVLAQPYYLKSAIPTQSGNQVVHHCSSSIGVTLFDGSEGNVDDLLKRADMAMYQAKHAGRNAVRFYDPQMQAALAQRTQMEKELRLAIKERQFELYYQVKVDRQHCPIAAEVLLRWQHPQRGVVLPDQFVGLMEETGLIIPAGLWVIETACSQIKTWQADDRFKHLGLSVNVSARQFRQANFVGQVQEILQLFAIPDGLLDIELTESLLLDDIDDTIAKMNQLKSLGVVFSLDDFGTGYSSLQYLKRLPFDQIKIDHSFVRDIASDSNDAAIIKTIIAMAGALDLRVIAEGVEDEAQHAFLAAQDCHYLQGYLFGRPASLAQFEMSLQEAAVTSVSAA